MPSNSCYRETLILIRIELLENSRSFFLISSNNIMFFYTQYYNANEYYKTSSLQNQTFIPLSFDKGEGYMLYNEAVCFVTHEADSAGVEREREREIS